MMTTIAAKADHVRAAHQSRPHECHWPGCHKLVPPAMWGCGQHWYRLPLALRTEIWRAYQVGQEETGTPSRDYVAAARKVQAWIAANS